MRYLGQVALLMMLLVSVSCVSKKKFTESQMQLEDTNNDLRASRTELESMKSNIAELEAQLQKLENDKTAMAGDAQMKEQTISDLRAQIDDLKAQRANAYRQIEDLTILSAEANKNVGNTIRQLEGKDEYIQYLQAAKSKTDSLNLALAVNLKGVLSDNIADQDVEIMVDKTVVYVNLSDKMLYRSGSSKITNEANAVLEKIAKIVKSRPDLEVMVEGYTDSRSISTECIEDNWDLSVKRATSVVRVLQEKHGVDPNKLIAAGRGEYNALADNDTPEGMAKNRRTRIILLPKTGQFYDLLDPATAPKM